MIVRHGGPAKVRTLLNLLKVSFRPDIDDNFKAHTIKNIENKARSAMYATHETAKALADPNKKKYLTDDVITNDLEYYLYLRKQYKTEELSKEDINQILLAVANDGMTEREAMQAIGSASITIGQINKIKAKRLYYMQVTNPAPLEREMEVFWHCGASNSGKTYYIKKYCQTSSEEKTFIALMIVRIMVLEALIIMMERKCLSSTSFEGI